MRKAALIVAVEMKAVFSLWGDPEERYPELPFKACRYCRHGRQIFVIRSGPGQLAAAAAAQLAVSRFGVSEIWNFGVAGGLVSGLATGDVCVVSRVIHRNSHVDTAPVRTAEPLEEKDIRSLQIDDIRIFTGISAASGDTVVARRKERAALAEETGAQLVEMEGAAVAVTAARNGVPCFMIKGISDDLDTPEKMLTEAFFEASRRTFRVTDRLMERTGKVIEEDAVWGNIQGLETE